MACLRDNNVKIYFLYHSNINNEGRKECFNKTNSKKNWLPQEQRLDLFLGI